MSKLFPTQGQKKRRGFTLTELAIVLGVIGTILSAVWVAAGKVNASNRTQKAAGQVLQIINGYRSLYGAHGIDVGGCFSSDVTCTGAIAGYFPSDMTAESTCSTGNGSTYPQTPWGGSSYVSVTTCQSNNTILIAYTNLSQAACISLANAILGATDLTYESIYNGSGWTSQWLPPYSGNTAWTSSQISSYCGANVSNVVQIGVSAR